MKIRGNSWGVWLGLVLVAASVCVGLFYLGKNHGAANKSAVPNQVTSINTTTSPSKLTFAAMGDMLAHDSIVAQAKTANGYDFKPYFSKILPLYREADLVFCNPETLATGDAYGVSGYPTFNAPTEFARDLVQGAKCDMINLASNHTNDKRQAAINKNLDVWEALKPVAYAGSNRSPEEQSKIQYFTKKGIKIAFLAFADYSNDPNLTPYGVNIYHDHELVKRLMTEARANADAVIVSAHWGTEDSTVVNADQIATAQEFTDLGADVVIGTGPHVLQKVTYLEAADTSKTLVWYSIGNMLSSQLKLEELTSGIAGFSLKKESKGVTVSDPTFKPTFMSYDWAPADKAAEKLDARTNLTLYPLKQAGSRIANMFGSQYGPDERLDYIKQTLTNESGVSIIE